VTSLSAVRLGDPPERWSALGFALADSQVALGDVRLELGVDGSGIVSWRLRGLEPGASIDGLATDIGDDAAEPEMPRHPNGALGLDHVVVLTPDFDRTASALAHAGIPLRRTREAPGGIRQGFRRLGSAILELVEARDAGEGPARFWGLVVIVSDLNVLAERLGDHLGDIRSAVQPGRQIATLRSSAGLGEAVAFMTPEPR
jgi:hypothetical protein